MGRMPIRKKLNYIAIPRKIKKSFKKQKPPISISPVRTKIPLLWGEFQVVRGTMFSLFFLFPSFLWHFPSSFFFFSDTFLVSSLLKCSPQWNWISPFPTLQFSFLLAPVPPPPRFPLPSRHSPQLLTAQSCCSHPAQCPFGWLPDYSKVKRLPTLLCFLQPPPGVLVATWVCHEGDIQGFRNPGLYRLRRPLAPRPQQLPRGRRKPIFLAYF